LAKLAFCIFLKPSEIARGDPQKPQTFYMMSDIQEVQNGDYLSARCTYNTTMKDKTTNIGTVHNAH